jgi:hypothetical protein
MSDGVLIILGWRVFKPGVEKKKTLFGLQFLPKNCGENLAPKLVQLSEYLTKSSKLYFKPFLLDHMWYLDHSGVHGFLAKGWRNYFKVQTKPQLGFPI